MEDDAGQDVVALRSVTDRWMDVEQPGRWIVDRVAVPFGSSDAVGYPFFRRPDRCKPEVGIPDRFKPTVGMSVILWAYSFEITHSDCNPHVTAPSAFEPRLLPTVKAPPP
ncbi:hypothetical protein OPV22_014755 [Ensete ventricosum]|uniref:Uncharacterized protein n=1 Tax=Ensete ventricosum TaxID=4639 RepID=A0AAV8R3Y5_ENSVE|nr:hypothetical protein OPV22_014755 [Ensete ventricosum]